MSVLINMEMPTNCWEDDCPCLNKQYGFCQADDDKGFVYSNKPEWCPLVPVPPHGRLIDGDALEDDGPDVCNSGQESYRSRRRRKRDG